MLTSHSPAPRTVHLPLVRRSSGTRCLCFSHRLSGTGLPGLPGGSKANGLRGCTYVLQNTGWVPHLQEGYFRIFPLIENKAIGIN